MVLYITLLLPMKVVPNFVMKKIGVDKWGVSGSPGGSVYKADDLEH